MMLGATAGPVFPCCHQTGKVDTMMWSNAGKYAIAGVKRSVQEMSAPVTIDQSPGKRSCVTSSGCRDTDTDTDTGTSETGTTVPYSDEEPHSEDDYDLPAPKITPMTISRRFALHGEKAPAVIVATQEAPALEPKDMLAVCYSVVRYIPTNLYVIIYPHTHRTVSSSYRHYGKNILQRPLPYSLSACGDY